MLPSLASCFRLLILALMAGHVFYMYCLARTMAETFGFDAAVTAGSAVFAAVMMIPLLWAVTLPELPDVAQWFRAQRRWRTGRCTDCGYEVRGVPSASCPECATRIAAPAGYRLSVAAVRRFAVMVVAAWLLGTVTGEAWTRHDEQQFARDLRVRMAAGAAGSYSRPRSWPSGSASLNYDPSRGVFATE